jgi:hypothetical protein
MRKPRNIPSGLLPVADNKLVALRDEAFTALHAYEEANSTYEKALKKLVKDFNYDPVTIEENVYDKIGELDFDTREISQADLYTRIVRDEDRKLITRRKFGLMMSEMGYRRISVRIGDTVTKAWTDRPVYTHTDEYKRRRPIDYPST